MLFTIYGALHRKSDAYSLSILKKEEGGGLISIEDRVELAKGGLKVYIDRSDKSFI